ncbi:tyrosyl-tRNA synthetase [Aspergillus nanangensis]|uniref:Tyrosine--tRNA ligase n=1 Tax=Aspergillus nanangensis TaxID=2582783 RepID=A0AAD4CLM0_ASPNN|nr:tyrosyl-tRNA synthetase [Aspergillus nanangensis]
MRPRLGAVPPARLHGITTRSVFSRLARGNHNYARTTDALRSSFLLSSENRPSLTTTPIVTGLPTRRWITQQWQRRTKEAEEEWSRFASQIKAGERKSFVEHLEERGLLHDVVGERDLLHRVFTEKRVGMYAGIDPTAPSMHVGHMLPFMVLAWGYVWGLPVTFLLGGSTSRVGDPTGRLKGREQVQSSIRKANMASMHMQLKKLGASIETYGKRHGYEKGWIQRRALVNNNTWWNKVPFIEVLRDLGSHMRLGPMLGRETVKNRLSKGDGMSFAEFTYPLMQAWDWWTLFRHGCQVQVGGSDQYGNILFGMDSVKAISKNTAIEEQRDPLEDDLNKPIGFTTPLLTAPSGEKFGKSAGNAIWLDKDMTSTFELYQFFVRTPDDAVERYLKMFTFVPLPEIAQIVERQNEDPSQRVAQHLLAYEFVELIHGKDEAEAVARQHRQLFRPRSSTAEPTPLGPLTSPRTTQGPEASFVNPQSGNAHAPQTNFKNMPNMNVTLPRSLVYNQTFNKVLWSAGLVSSKGEGHRVIVNRGAYVGSRPGDSGPMGDNLSFTPIQTWENTKTQEFIIDSDLMFLKLGKWKFKMVKIVSDEEFKQLGLTAPGWEPEQSESDENETKAPNS